MAIIIETCPKCGHDLIDEVICTNPPIPNKGCPNCGWYWEGEPEEVIRRSFGGNSLIVDDLVGLQDYTNLNITNVSVGDGIIGGMLSANTIDVSNVKDSIKDDLIDSLYKIYEEQVHDRKIDWF